MVDFSLPKDPGARGPGVMIGRREIVKGPFRKGDRFLLLPLGQGLLGALPASSTPTPNPHRVFAEGMQKTPGFSQMHPITSKSECA